MYSVMTLKPTDQAVHPLPYIYIATVKTLMLLIIVELLPAHAHTYIKEQHFTVTGRLGTFFNHLGKYYLLHF